MNIQKLVTALEAESYRGNRSQEHQIFIRLLTQVWSLDWTIPVYEVWKNMKKGNIPYFEDFMRYDVGDEGQERRLIIELVTFRMQMAMQKQQQKLEYNKAVRELLAEMNRLKATVEKQS